jgi:predicted nucleotide-binding protein (sugar kinase/HSP70/actin superfamily)
VLNLWSTHQFWLGFLEHLGVPARHVEFSSDTSEDQARSFGKGRGTVDCCYPVKCVSGHYGELLARDRHHKIDVLLSPMIYSLPSFLAGQVMANLACPRVMAAPENIKAGFLKESDAFAANNVRYVAPLVALGDPPLVPRQIFTGLQDAIPGLTFEETRLAVDAGYRALDAFASKLRARAREVLERCAREEKPCILVLARPYHMDPGIGHEIEVDLQARGYPVLWTQYLPTDAPLLDWMFGEDVAAGHIKTPLDIADVWPSSYSANTNEILWAAKFAARMPWVACVVRLSSYECGMDQPTYSPVQQIVERSGTLFFSFQDLDSTKPAGSVKIRVETIAHYLEKRSAGIIAKKKAAAPEGCPLPWGRYGPTL